MTKNENLLDGVLLPIARDGWRGLWIGALALASLSGCATTAGPGAGIADADSTRVAAEAGEAAAGEDSGDQTEAARRTPRVVDSYVIGGKRYFITDSGAGYVENGLASWYGRPFHGRRTSSGERYDMYALTAAHKSLPLPTYVEVTNLDNGRSVLVKVNDRGPFVDERVIDLSYAAARELAMVDAGVVRVEVRAIDPAGDAGPAVSLAAAAPEGAPAGAETGGAGAAGAQRGSAAEGPGQADKGELYVRVGAFGERENAERLRRRLLDHLSEQVAIRSGDAAGARPYRLEVGPLATPEEAEGVTEQLAALGLARPQTVIQ